MLYSIGNFKIKLPLFTLKKKKTTSLSPAQSRIEEKKLKDSKFKLSTQQNKMKDQAPKIKPNTKYSATSPLLQDK